MDDDFDWSEFDWGRDTDYDSPSYTTTTIDQEQPNQSGVIGIHPDGGVDAQGNPTYVDIYGNPVTASGVPIGNANEYVQLEGGGSKRLNPNGSISYIDPDGSSYTVNTDGSFTNALGQTYNPTTQKWTDAYGRPMDNASGNNWLNTFKSYFQKKDAQGNILKDAQGNPMYDWGKIVSAGAAAASLSGLNTPNRPPTGYQGGIPSLTAVRAQIPGTYDPNRRAGSSGQRYFTDLAYVDRGDTEGIQAAKERLAAGANDLRQENAANPAYQQKKTYERTTPVSTGMFGMPTVTNPASSLSSYMTPEQRLAQQKNASAVQAAQGGLMGMAKGRYLRGETDGMADELNTSIDDKQPAKLSHGEFVIPADVVSHLGNGNSDAGAKKLYQMMDRVRHARTGTKKQGKKINPDKYMPGGLASIPQKHSKAPIIQGFSGTTGSTVAQNAAAGVTGTESNLSNWAGQNVTTILGKGEALANKPYEAYQGPLTAGESDLQKTAFQNAINLNVPTQNMGGYKATAFGEDQAKQYMNPFLKTALDPQLEELRRQQQINMQGELGRLGRAGGYGGGRQAVLEARNAEALLREQNKTVGKGYLDAYNKAMEQFNTDQGMGMKAQELTNQYGLSALQKQAELGKEQRGIEAEGIAADLAQFEQEKLDPYKKLQFQQSLLQGLPLQAQQYNTADQSTLQKLLGAGADSAAIVKQLQDMGVLPKTATTTTG